MALTAFKALCIIAYTTLAFSSPLPKAEPEPKASPITIPPLIPTIPVSSILYLTLYQFQIYKE